VTHSGPRRRVGMPACLAASVALVAVLTGLPAVPSFASSTASTGLSTTSSTGLTVPPTTGASGTSGAQGTGTTSGSPSTPSTQSTQPALPTLSTAAARTSVVLGTYNPVVSPTVPLSLSGQVNLPPSESGGDLVVRASVVTGGLTSRAALERVRANPKSVAYDHALSDPVPVGPDHTFTFHEQPNLALPQLTIYPMRVAVYREGQSTPIAATYTFLVWAPPQSAVKPTAISTVLPISAPPKLRSDGMLSDDSLAQDIAPGGRLYTLLHALPAGGQPSTVALALDPTLLKALKVMAGEGTYGTPGVCKTIRGPCYRFASPGGVREQTASTYAAAFLEDLRAFAGTAGNTVFALPWGDADLAALVHAGKLYDANYAVNTGRRVVAEVLDRDIPDVAPVTYPADGLADAATLAFLAAEGVDMSTVVLDDQLLPAASTKMTPTALTVQQTPAGPIRALAADSKLAELVTTPEAEASAPTALGDLVAELAMITLERPGQHRLAVLALPRDWNPSADVAGQVLRAVGSAAAAGFQPFFSPTTLRTDALTAADTEAGGSGSTGSTGPSATAPSATAPSATTTTAGPARRGLIYPQWATDREIPTFYVDAVEHLRDDAALLDPVLCTQITGSTATSLVKCGLRDTVVTPMKDTLLTALSVQWRTDRTGAVQLSQEVDGRINLIRKSIDVVASSKVTLTSREGTVPLTVNNTSDANEGNAFPMTVMLKLSSNDKTRLRSASKILVTVQPGGVRQELISVSSDSAGSFPVFVQVMTPDEKRLTSQPERILVRSTAYGAIATAVTYAAVGLFAAAVLLRFVRRRRRRGEAGHDAGGDRPGEPSTVADVTRTGPHTMPGTDPPTTPVRRIQANAAGTQRTESERAYAGGVPANPSEP